MINRLAAAFATNHARLRLTTSHYVVHSCFHVSQSCLPDPAYTTAYMKWFACITTHNNNNNIVTLNHTQIYGHPHHRVMSPHIQPQNTEIQPSSVTFTLQQLISCSSNVFISCSSNLLHHSIYVMVCIYNHTHINNNNIVTSNHLFPHSQTRQLTTYNTVHDIMSAQYT